MLLLLLLLSFLLVLNCLTVARVIIMITLVITLGDAIEIRIWMNHHVESNLVLYVSHVFFWDMKESDHTVGKRVFLTKTCTFSVCSSGFVQKWTKKTRDFPWILPSDPNILHQTLRQVAIADAGGPPASDQQQLEKKLDGRWWQL